MGAQTIGNIPADIATDEEYSKIISEINMTGVESAYAYLVSEDGTMIYHPTADKICLLYTSPSPRDGLLSRMPSSA